MCSKATLSFSVIFIELAVFLETGFISVTHFKDVKKFWHLATIVELDNHSILSVYRRTTQEDLQILN